MNPNSIIAPIFAGLILSFLVACTPATNVSDSSTSATGLSKASDQDDASEDAKIDRFFQEIYDREVAQDPETQTYLGLNTNDQDKWFDRSDMSHQANVAEAKSDLERLAAFDRSAVSEDNRTSYDLLQYQLEETIGAAPYRRHSYCS